MKALARARHSYVPESPRKVLFLIRSLARSGAERQLCNLAKELHRRGVPVSVAVYYRRPGLEDELTDAGIIVHCLDKRSRFDFVGFTWRLLSLVRCERPAVLHSYMPTSNLFGALVKWCIPEVRLVWGIRNCPVRSRVPLLTRLVFIVQRALSAMPDLVIFNSHHSLELHGFSRATDETVVPNGIDTDRFQPCPQLRHRVRSEWHVREDQVLVGIVGRIAPAKNHSLFVSAAALLAERHPHLKFVCVGRGEAEAVRALQAQADHDQRGLDMAFPGERTDIEAVYNALDVLVLCSEVEGFPNVVAEAMACGTPCVVSLAGDAPMIVEGLGEIVSELDAPKLAEAVERLLPRLSPWLSHACRQRIASLYTNELLAERTLEALGL
ncbi:MAG TPA: glycosyltransferase [Fimbriimonadaceae bacterium]|nr:glycosyltransferase [Fimbriimonadaceae bacterium]